MVEKSLLAEKYSELLNHIKELEIQKTEVVNEYYTSHKQFMDKLKASNLELFFSYYKINFKEVAKIAENKNIEEIKKEYELFKKDKEAKEEVSNEVNNKLVEVLYKIYEIFSRYEKVKLDEKDIKNITKNLDNYKNQLIKDKVLKDYIKINEELLLNFKITQGLNSIGINENNFIDGIFKLFEEFNSLKDKIKTAENKIENINKEIERLKSIIEVRFINFSDYNSFKKNINKVLDNINDENDESARLLKHLLLIATLNEKYFNILRDFVYQQNKYFRNNKGNINNIDDIRSIDINLIKEKSNIIEILFLEQYIKEVEEKNILAIEIYKELLEININKYKNLQLDENIDNKRLKELEETIKNNKIILLIILIQSNYTHFNKINDENIKILKEFAKIFSVKYNDKFFLPLLNGDQKTALGIAYWSVYIKKEKVGAGGYKKDFIDALEVLFKHYFELLEKDNADPKELEKLTKEISEKTARFVVFKLQDESFKNTLKNELPELSEKIEKVSSLYNKLRNSNMDDNQISDVMEIVYKHISIQFNEIINDQTLTTK